jgi:hypothetical protein
MASVARRGRRNREITVGALSFLLRDAADTIDRMKADARHLAELGQRGKVAARMAIAQTKAKIDSAIERVADGVLEAEQRYERFRGRR